MNRTNATLTSGLPGMTLSLLLKRGRAAADAGAGARNA